MTAEVPAAPVPPKPGAEGGCDHGNRVCIYDQPATPADGQVVPMVTSTEPAAIRLTRVNGVWTSPDGMTTIGPAEGITMCENGHPMRWKDEHGITRTGYCPGGEEHDYTKGWDIRGDLHGLPDNAYGTFREARDALVGAIQRERS